MSNAETMSESVTLCQNMLDKLMSWCDLNKLTVNINKTKCMFINPSANSTDDRLSIHGIQLDIVKQFEYLGMHIDDKLSMNKHVDSMIKKTKCKLGILYRIRKFISRDTSLLIYKVMIRPHMEYGDLVVDLASKKHIDKLERLQEKGLRLTEYQAPGKKNDISKLKLEFRVEDLSIRRKRSLLRLMYRQSKDDVNRDIIKKGMILRSDKKIKLKVEFTRLSKIQKSPYYRGLDLWNKLPDSIQKESSIIKFKSKVKDHLT